MVRMNVYTECDVGAINNSTVKLTIGSGTPSQLALTVASQNVI